MRLPSIRQFLNASVANTAKAAAEKPWNTVFARAAERGLVPNSLFGKATVFFALTYLGEATALNVNSSTLTGKVTSELVGDMASEFLSRAWSFAQQPGNQLAKNPNFAALVRDIVQIKGESV